VLLGNMELEQRFTCALVCSDWAKAAAATTDSIEKVGLGLVGLEDLTGLQEWLEKYGSQVKTLRLHVSCQADMPRLPCTQLRDLRLCGSDQLTLEGRLWNDIAAATKLTSVSLQHVFTNSQQADVVSALTALPDLQQLTWREVQCGQGQKLLLDSRLLQQLTKVTRLKLDTVLVEALQHLGSMSKLQRLCLMDADVWDAAEIPGLQQLMALTSLKMRLHLEGLPSVVSNLTALQQLQLWAATPTELNCLKALTALTKLRVGSLNHDHTPLQLPALHSLDLEFCSFSGAVIDLHVSQLSSCTELRQLSLQQFRLVGPDSLAASSMLQKLHLQDCSLSSSEGPACVNPWQLVFPGPARLPHLTLLLLVSVSPAPQQADLERLVACCSGLRQLELAAAQSSWSLASTSAFECLSHLTRLSELELGTIIDQQCSSLAKLTGLRSLVVSRPDEMSPLGLRHLACLQQLTYVLFSGAFDSHKVSTRLQLQLTDGFARTSCTLMNRVRICGRASLSDALITAYGLHFKGRD